MAVAGGLVILLIAVIVVGYRTYKYEQVSIKCTGIYQGIYNPMERCARDTLSFQQSILDQTVKDIGTNCIPKISHFYAYF